MIEVKTVSKEEIELDQSVQYENYKNLADAVLSKALEDALSGADISDFIGSEIYDLYLAISHFEPDGLDAKIRFINHVNTGKKSKMPRRFGKMVIGSYNGKTYQFLSINDAARKTGMNKYAVNQIMNGKKNSEWKFRFGIKFNKGEKIWNT